MSFQIRFTRQAKKDVEKLSPKLQNKLKSILRRKIAVNPYDGKPLKGELKGFYSIRLTYQDRIIYSIDKQELLVVIIRAKTHYGQ